MAKKRKFRRVLVIADTHCGHNVGLTPPQWWHSPKRQQSNWPSSIARTQRRMWGEYTSHLNSLKPIDILIDNGDNIEGKGPKSGGRELITTDREEQCRMAIQCIRQVEASKIVMIYGTPYHTGANEDWETYIANEVGAENIGSHEWPQVGPLVFDVKHFVGASSIPHGRHTAVSKEQLWNAIWAERQEQPKGDIVIRSHVHYHAFSGGPRWLGMTTPALQAAGTIYGGRRCSGTVDLGFIYFDVYEDGGYEWEYVEFTNAVRKAKPLKL